MTADDLRTAAEFCFFLALLLIMAAALLFVILSIIVFFVAGVRAMIATWRDGRRVEWPELPE